MGSTPFQRAQCTVHTAHSCVNHVLPCPCCASYSDPQAIPQSCNCATILQLCQLCANFGILYYRRSPAVLQSVFFFETWYMPGTCIRRVRPPARLPTAERMEKTWQLPIWRPTMGREWRSLDGGGGPLRRKHSSRRRRKAGILLLLFLLSLTPVAIMWGRSRARHTHATAQLSHASQLPPPPSSPQLPLIPTSHAAASPPSQPLHGLHGGGDRAAEEVPPPPAEAPPRLPWAAILVAHQQRAKEGAARPPAPHPEPLSQEEASAAADIFFTQLLPCAGGREGGEGCGASGGASAAEEPPPLTDIKPPYELQQPEGQELLLLLRRIWGAHRVGAPSASQPDAAEGAGLSSASQGSDRAASGGGVGVAGDKTAGAMHGVGGGHCSTAVGVELLRQAAAAAQRLHATSCAAMDAAVWKHQSIKLQLLLHPPLPPPSTTPQEPPTAHTAAHTKKNINPFGLALPRPGIPYVVLRRATLALLHGIHSRNLACRRAIEEVREQEEQGGMGWDEEEQGGSGRVASGSSRSEVWQSYIP